MDNLSEREAIVNFLKHRLAKSLPVMGDKTWSAAFNCGIEYAADAIFRGDHLSKSSPITGYDNG